MSPLKMSEMRLAPPCFPSPPVSARGSPGSSRRPSTPHVVNLYKVTAAKKLVLRAAAEIRSAKIGNVYAGHTVLLLEERAVTDEHGPVVRARVGVDSKPRCARSVCVVCA